MSELKQAFVQILEGAEIYYVSGINAVSADCSVLADALVDAVGYTRPDTDDEVRRLETKISILMACLPEESRPESGRIDDAKFRGRDMEYWIKLSEAAEQPSTGAMREALECISMKEPETDGYIMQSIAEEALSTPKPEGEQGGEYCEGLEGSYRVRFVSGCGEDRLWYPGDGKTCGNPDCGKPIRLQGDQ
jgi:hypothetical protein